MKQYSILTLDTEQLHPIFKGNKV